MEIFKEFTFDSAHFLPNVAPGHKCRGMHGHTYRLVVFIEGEVDKDLGWVMDFADLKRVIEPIVDSVDHKLLNEIKGLENPTCEIFAIWLWDSIKPQIPLLSKIELNETPTSGVVYRGK
jgi:6-pyruvoyltetrahydropterin/6-carboxytetrahydropterin synthase